MEKGAEQVRGAQTANPVKQSPMEAQSSTQTVDLHPSASPPPEHPEHLPIEDLIQKASSPESYQPAPDEDTHSEQEPHTLPTTTPEEQTDEHSTLPTNSAATAASDESTERSTSVTGSPDVSQLLSSSTDLPQEGGLPVLQEDHTPDVHVLPSSSQDVTGHQDEETTTHVEETDDQSTTVSTGLLVFDSSTSENHPTDEGSGEESAESPLDEETQSSVTQSSDTSSTSDDVVTTSDSGAFTAGQSYIFPNQVWPVLPICTANKVLAKNKIKTLHLRKSGKKGNYLSMQQDNCHLTTYL